MLDDEAGAIVSAARTQLSGFGELVDLELAGPNNSGVGCGARRAQDSFMAISDDSEEL